VYKKYTYHSDSGTKSLITALKLLNAKKVIIPTYTCTDILSAVKLSNCEYYIVDCGFDLQIDVKDVIKNSSDYDTIIIPHMFGIRADIESIRKNTDLKIIEDLSQCHGLKGLGNYSDIVISSTNKSKWLDKNGGGFIFTDNKIDHELPVNFSKYKNIIKEKLIRRIELANEIKESGVNLIGEESAWLRGMYFTNHSSRKPYIPLHKIVGTFECPKVDYYIDKVNWISIIA
jgi:dTDP-4-amino-4,6-dideoxygalactose transaminase